MDPNLMLIFGFVLVVGTIALLGGMLIHRRTVIHEERKLELQARIEEAKAGQVQQASAEQAHLEDRLRVLERIVTDPTADLSKQIDSLRDREVEAQ